MRRRMCFVFAAGLMLAVVVAPAATAGSGGTDRPFRAEVVGQTFFDFPGTSPSGCEEITTFADASGRASHLGNIRYRSSHCPLELENPADGVFVIVAANGAKLRGTYDYDDTSASPDFEIAFDGGTGRFANAVGHGTLTYSVVPVFIPGCDPEVEFCFDLTVPWDWQATITGTISY